MAKHTDLPWRKDIGSVVDEPYLRSVVGPDGQTIRLKGFAIAGGNVGQEEGEANTDFVLRAVNCHAALLAQHESNIVDLEFLLRAIEEGDPKPELVIRVKDILRRSREATAKAEGS